MYPLFPCFRRHTQSISPKFPTRRVPYTALAYHNAQLEASAFREEFDPEAFEDLTVPKYEMMHKVSSEDTHPSSESRSHAAGTPALPTPTPAMPTPPDGTSDAPATHIHSSQRAGELMRKWKKAILEDETANVLAAPTSSRKRKAVSNHAGEKTDRA